MNLLKCSIKWECVPCDMIRALILLNIIFQPTLIIVCNCNTLFSRKNPYILSLLNKTTDMFTNSPCKGILGNLVQRHFRWKSFLYSIDEKIVWGNLDRPLESIRYIHWNLLCCMKSYSESSEGLLIDNHLFPIEGNIFFILKFAWTSHSETSQWNILIKQWKNWKELLLPWCFHWIDFSMSLSSKMKRLLWHLEQFNSINFFKNGSTD